MLNLTRLLFVIFIVCSSIASNANAVVILSTYPAKQEGTKFSFSDSNWEAIGFRTGVQGSYDLENITLRLSSLAGGDVSVSVHSTVKSPPYQCGFTMRGPSYCQYNKPGEMLGSEAVTAVGQKGDYAFSFSGVKLAESSLYWIVVKGKGAGSFHYYEESYASAKDPVTGIFDWTSLYKSGVGAAIYDFARSPTLPCGSLALCEPSVLGESWQYHSGLNMISIEGSASQIPEPASLVLIIAGLAGLLRARSVKRAKQPAEREEFAFGG